MSNDFRAPNPIHIRLLPGTAALFAVLLTASSAQAQTKQPIRFRGEVLNLTAKWCMGCQVVAPTVSRLARAGWPIRKVDVDQNKALVRSLGVQTIPAFVLMIDGKMVKKVEARLSEQQIHAMLVQIPQRKPDPGVVLASSTAPAAAPTAPGTSLGAAAPFEMPVTDTVPPPKFDIPAVATADASEDRLFETSVHDSVEQPADMPTTALMTSSLPFDSSVRIRVKDGGGVALGSGTVIFSRVGLAYILTCAHIFRDTDEQSSISVDFFDGEKTVTWAGSVIKYNMEADVGLLSIEPKEPLPTALVAGLNARILAGDPVCCIGCSAGNDPTKMNLKVTELNRYTGPDNIECTGLPVQGRSGGGLFNSNQELIGICIAADKKDKRGLYAGLKAVHKLLDVCELSYLYRPEPPPSFDVSTPDVRIVEQNPESIPAGDVFAMAEVPSVAEPVTFASLREAANAQLSGAAGAEVICVIQSQSNPARKSNVVVMDRSSASFLRYLDQQMQTGATSVRQRVPVPIGTPTTLASSRPSAVPARVTNASFTETPRFRRRASLTNTAP